MPAGPTRVGGQTNKSIFDLESEAKSETVRQSYEPVMGTDIILCALCFVILHFL